MKLYSLQSLARVILIGERDSMGVDAQVRRTQRRDSALILSHAHGNHDSHRAANCPACQPTGRKAMVLPKPLTMAAGA